GCTASPFSVEMKMQISSMPVASSQPHLTPRLMAKRSALVSSGPSNWWPHSWLYTYIFTAVESGLIRLVLRMTKPGKAPPQLSKFEFNTVGRLPQFTDLPSILRSPCWTSLASAPASFRYSSTVGPPLSLKVASCAVAGGHGNAKTPSSRAPNSAAEMVVSLIGQSLRG